MVWIHGVDMPVGRMLLEIRLQVPTQVTDDGQFVLFVRGVALPDPGVYDADTRYQECLVGNLLHHCPQIAEEFVEHSSLIEEHEHRRGRHRAVGHLRAIWCGLYSVGYMMWAIWCGP